jgi:hypothetical protein
MVGYVFPARTVCREEFESLGHKGTATTIYYERGTDIVREKGKRAIAVRGTLVVRGHTFDTIERAGGYVYLQASATSYLCHMEESHKFKGRHQIRPVHTIHNAKNQLANILIHAGSVPSNFEGCIGVGIESAQGLRDSRACMAQLFDLLGGFQAGASVWLQVTGDMTEDV